MHNCEPKYAKEHENYAIYGAAIYYCSEGTKEIEDIRNEGEFWAGNMEYETRVNFCPFCGQKAPKQIENKEI